MLHIELCDTIQLWENQRAGRLTLFFGGANPPDERKEGVANGSYIHGFIPVLYLHCCPCRIVLHDFQGETEIAATTAIVTAVVKTVA